MKVNLNLKGLDDLMESLVKAGENVDETACEALVAGGEVALEGFQRRVPVDTGKLRESLLVDNPNQDGNLITVILGHPIKGPNKAPADVARYGNTLEWGSYKMAAQPFIRPTMAADKGKINKALRKKLEEKGVL